MVSWHHIRFSCGGPWAETRVGPPCGVFVSSPGPISNVSMPQCVQVVCGGSPNAALAPGLIVPRICAPSDSRTLAPTHPGRTVAWAVRVKELKPVFNEELRTRKENGPDFGHCLRGWMRNCGGVYTEK